MAKLVSGRVEKISSANVSADRYEFLSLQEAEPDLGLPASNVQVLASNTDGTRFFITLNTNDITEADNLYYTNDRVAAYLQDANLALTFTDLVVSGNLTVQGDTTTLNTATLVVEDKNIIIANGAPNAAAANGAGITIDGAQANITFNSLRDSFDFNRSIYAKYYSLYGGNPDNSSEIGNLGYGGNTIALSGNEGVQIVVGTDEVSPYWDFDTSGNLTAPGDINSAANISAQYVTGAEKLAYNEKVQDSIVELDENSLTIQYFTGPAGNVSVKLPNSNVCLPGQKFIVYNDGINYIQVLYGDYSNSLAIPAFWSATYIAHQDPDANVTHWTEYVSASSISGSGAAVGTFEPTIINPTISNPVIVNSIDSSSTSFALLNNSEVHNVNAFGVANVVNIGAPNGLVTFAGNILVTNRIFGNVEGQVSSLSNHTTSNLVEGDNLYYTNARARTAYTAGENITIVDGTISAIQNLSVVNDSTTILSEANTLTYSMGRTITDPRNILVIIEGLIQIPTTDYSVAGESLIFVDQPPVGSNIEVRFFGVETSRGATPTLISAVNSFTGDGSNVIYSLSITPPNQEYISVIIDGVAQLNSAYSLIGNQLTFTDAPSDGANIDVRIVTGRVSSGFTTRNFTGDGVSNTYSISSGYDEHTILVFENGVAQVPGTDYSIVNSNVVFATAPAANVGIQIRELGTNGANLLTTIAGLDQTTGNLIPAADGVYSLGRSDFRFKDLYLTGNTIVLGDISLSSTNGSLVLSPVVSGNIDAGNTKPASFTAGENITIEANGRISSSGATTGKAIAMAIVFGG